MDDVERLVCEARNDATKLNELIGHFLPFIKKCVARSKIDRQSRDDALTLAMLAFADCVKSYDIEKGAFIAYAQTSIRNRLIDDYRTEKRRATVPVDDAPDGWERALSVLTYQRQLEHTALRQEIEEITEVLRAWNTSFAELAKIGPKHKRTRAQCLYIIELLLKNEVWRKQLTEKHRLPGKELCAVYGVSHKLLDKYRKYIAALCVIQNGDYPMLKTFLPTNRQAEGDGHA